MVTYCYRCTKCRIHYDVEAPMGQAPLVYNCSGCGGEAVRHFTVPDVCIKASSNSLVYDPKFTVPSMARKRPGFGKKRGLRKDARTDLEQHRLYQGIVEDARKEDARYRRSRSRKKDADECRRIGKMPLEINEYIANMTGDPSAVARDPEYWHKVTGTWTGG